MTLSSRIKLIFGILFVIGLIVMLLLYLQYSLSRAHSTVAQIKSDNYTIGVDYSGTIEDQFIAEGDSVELGDTLFEINSPTLAEAIRDNEITETTTLYEFTDDNIIKISAVADGTVQDVFYQPGAFVPANSELAVINTANGLFIEATYKLSSPDYARLDTDSLMVVTFPDNTKLDATVYNIALNTEDNEVYTTVRARINEDQINQVVFNVGTPVETVLYLDNDTWYSTIYDSVRSLFQPTSGN